MDKTQNFEYDIEFFDREKEKEEILNILKTKPQFINFIYGPINSGKTALITNLIEELPKDYVVFYINLRQNPVSTYKDFLEELFDVEFEDEIKERKIKKVIPDAIADLKTLFGIPIPSKTFERIFSEEDPKNAFKYMLKIIRKIKEHNKIPVLIIDELQVIGDIEIDGKLIYKVFNFFISLTKELHICHVFALSSDSLFIEKIYNEAMLQGRANFVLVDDFDEETIKKFLEKYKFSKEEQEIVWNNIGGKPIYLIRIVNAKHQGKDIAGEIKKILESRKKEINDTLRKLKRFESEIVFENKNYKVDYNETLSTLKMFKDNDKILESNIDEVVKIFLVKKNILFAECVNEIIKPQSKVDLIAIREILKEMKNGIKKDM